MRKKCHAWSIIPKWLNVDSHAHVIAPLLFCLYILYSLLTVLIYLQFLFMKKFECAHLCFTWQMSSYGLHQSASNDETEVKTMQPCRTLNCECDLRQYVLHALKYVHQHPLVNNNPMDYVCLNRKWWPGIFSQFLTFTKGANWHK